jgi:predicted AlkP superfamily phosphohydrolase/phosphomutase
MKRKNKEVSSFEIIAARCWNMLNEGKSFFIIFSLFILVLVTIIQKKSAVGLGYSLLLTLPLWLMFFAYDFPLRYRTFLWILLAVYIVVFGYYNILAIALIILIYFFFTIIFWGTIYYHLRIGTKLTNFKRFWKLVLENSDSTSGNSMEQLPKALIIVTINLSIMSIGISIGKYFIYLLLALAFALLSDYLFFKKVVRKETGKLTEVINENEKLAERVIVLVIDGCRKDKLERTNTPNIDFMKKNGVYYNKMRTVYPSRTVTCFSSMFSGAGKEKHGIKSNLVMGSLLGKEEMKCESLFDVLKENKKKAKIVGIAHLKDVFGENVETVSAIHSNETVDKYIMEKTQKVMEKYKPQLMVTQFIAVDQTGHARGTSYEEYEQKIREVDKIIGDFVKWLKKKKMFDDSVIIIMSDHGQSYRGIGGHGHWDKGEKYVPFIIYGKNIKKGKTINKEKRILDLAPTIAYILGIKPPEDSIGETLIEAVEKQVD